MKQKLLQRKKLEKLNKIEKLISSQYQPELSQKKPSQSSYISIKSFESATSQTNTQAKETSSIIKQTPSNKRKRKSVRFNETTLLHNENKEEVKQPEKGHLNAEDFFLVPEIPENIQISKKPMLNYPQSSLDDTISLTDTASNDTMLLDDEPTATFDCSARQSFYEYDSILFPKTSKYIDVMSMTTQDMSSIQEQDDGSNETKETKRDKKIVSIDKTKMETQTVYLTLMSMELHVKIEFFKNFKSHSLVKLITVFKLMIISIKILKI